MKPKHCSDFKQVEAQTDNVAVYGGRRLAPVTWWPSAGAAKPAISAGAEGSQITSNTLQQMAKNLIRIQPRCTETM